MALYVARIADRHEVKINERLMTQMFGGAESPDTPR